MADCHYTKRYNHKCLVCNVEFIGFKSQFCCSQKCNQLNYRRSKGVIPKDEYESKRKNANHYFVCKYCLKNSYRTLGGSSTKNVYCSYECLKADTVKRRIIKAKVISESKALKRIKRYKEQKRFTKFNCIDCNALIFKTSSVMGRPVRRCNECQKINEAKQLKANRLFYKASRKFNSSGDRFIPEQVFIRDEWKCRICGIDTPKHLRGKNLDNSPELDHVIPLSKGGMHTIENTQCLCRQCNLIKSDHILADPLKFIQGRRGVKV